MTPDVSVCSRYLSNIGDPYVLLLRARAYTLHRANTYWYPNLSVHATDFRAFVTPTVLANVEEGLQDAPETLEDLGLTKNQIPAGIPSKILSLANLQNSISLPKEIGNLKLLKALYLFSNKIDGTLPTDLVYWTRCSSLRWATMHFMNPSRMRSATC
jgi:hypothetical protein